MVYVPWEKEDWRLRELLRSAESIQDLFRVYKENQERILKDPILRRFVIAVFCSKFYTGFATLVRANQQLWHLPCHDSIRRIIGDALVDQIGINY